MREIKKRVYTNRPEDPSQLIDSFKAHLLALPTDNITGIYIIGSIGLHDFNPHLSDIDFVVLTRQHLSRAEIKHIQNIHLELERKRVQPNLNGIYIRFQDLGKGRDEIDRMSFFYEGELKTVSESGDFFEINQITWAELKCSGLTIHGPENKQLPIEVNWDEVNQYLYENINSYWKKWLVQSNNPLHPYYYSTLFRKSDNAWCVSGVARQLYTLKEHNIVSKRGACEYFLDKAPSEFKPVLWDTIHFRKGLKTRPAWKQKAEIRRFLAYCIQTFNALYANKL